MKVKMYPSIRPMTLPAIAEGNFNIITEFKGEKLLGLHYEPLLPYLKDLQEVKESIIIKATNILIIFFIKIFS